MTTYTMPDQNEYYMDDNALSPETPIISPFTIISGSQKNKPNINQPHINNSILNRPHINKPNKIIIFPNRRDQHKWWYILLFVIFVIVLILLIVLLVKMDNKKKIVYQ